MTPEIKKDERIWLVAIHSDACDLKCKTGIVECCNLLDAPNNACTMENCPRKLMVGRNQLEEICL